MFEQFMYDKNDKYNLFEKEDLNIRRALSKRLFIEKALWYLLLIINIYIACNYIDIESNVRIINSKFEMSKGYTIFMSIILGYNFFKIINRTVYLYKIKVEWNKEEHGKLLLYSSYIIKKWYKFILSLIIIVSTMCHIGIIDIFIPGWVYLNILILVVTIEIVRLILKLAVNKVRVFTVKASLENIIEEFEENDTKNFDIEEELEDTEELEFLFGTRYLVLIRQVKKLLQKLVEVSGKEQQSTYSKSQLVTNLSHDLKTPLTSIINSVYILKNESLDKDETKEQITILKEKSNRLKTLIDNLNEVINCEENEVVLSKEEVNIYELVTQSINSFSSKFENSNLDIKINSDYKDIILNLDKDKIIRVFENLLSNIAKYSLEDTRVYIDIKKEDNYVNLVFKNICKYELDINNNLLGDRFVKGDNSRNSKGHGLGLSIVKNLMKLHKGETTINSEGDLFKVTLSFYNK